MTSLNLRTTKQTSRKLTRSTTSYCRRCGPECSCSEEELDAGGPANE